MRSARDAATRGQCGAGREPRAPRGPAPAGDALGAPQPRPASGDGDARARLNVGAESRAAYAVC